MAFRVLAWRPAMSLALAVVGALATASWAQSESPAPRRSIYDRRRPAAQPETQSPTSPPRELAGQSAARPLPAANQKPRAKPRGYSSRSIQHGRPAKVAAPAVARQPAPSQPATEQGRNPSGVMPAFYPAPLAAVEGAALAEADPKNTSQQICQQLTAKAGEHPLLPAVRWAKQISKKLESVQDYSCTMVKRERVDGTLSNHEYMSVKVRHEPFSIYIGFVGPAAVKGREAIYVRNKNEGKLQAHDTGFRKAFGTVSLKPDSYLAMSGNRYPITEMGLKRLTERLIEVGEHDSKFGECEVKASSVKINGRDCACLQVVHPVPRPKNFIFHMAKIYVDAEHNLPVRYEAYDWPAEEGGPPLLVEEYTYLNLKLNNGFTDQDFDVSNPGYQFR
jgi:hypothetical protein